MRGFLVASLSAVILLGCMVRGPMSAGDSASRQSAQQAAREAEALQRDPVCAQQMLEPMMGKTAPPEAAAIFDTASGRKLQELSGILSDNGRYFVRQNVDLKPRFLRGPASTTVSVVEVHDRITSQAI